MPSALLENLLLQGSKQTIPAFLYGTAWKKDRTADLVYQAVCCGFRGIDTAAQPKHYREDLVGEGLRRACREKKVSREDIFIQTKFTSIHGQNPHEMPYDPASTIAEQINASIKSSLHNLRPFDDIKSPYLDSLVLHSPLETMTETLEAWKALESFVPHTVRNLGISNVFPDQLEELYDAANVKPAVVQNRFYPQTHFDTQIRKFCSEKSIVYQSFWTLSANPKVLASKEINAVAQQLGSSNAEAMYCLVLGLENFTILNGTTTEGHMLGDLKSQQKARDWAKINPDAWSQYMKAFKALIGETE